MLSDYAIRQMVPESTYRAQAERVADYYTVAVDTILSRDRRTAPCEARHVLWAVLQRRGYNCAAIARAALMNHSSVLHGLQRVQARPELQRAAAIISDGRTRAGVDLEFASYPAGLRRPLLCYLESLRHGRPVTLDGLAGLYAIAADPELQDRVQRWLTRRERSQHYWRIQSHARQLGLTWAAGRPFAGEAS